MAFGDPDASTPAFVKANSATKAVTTASFTPPVGARLVACVVHDTAGGNLTNTSQVTDSQGLTWTRVATHSKQDDGTGANNGHIAVSIATVTTSVAMTVTTTGTNTNNPAGLYLLVVTGVDTTTPIDVVAEGHNTNALVSQAITIATNGARGYLVASDWNLAANMTAGSGQTAVVSDGIGAPDMRFYVGRQNAVAAPGTETESTGSPSTGNQNNWIAFALRPAAGGGSPSGDASLAVTASFGTTGTSDKPVASSLALTASVSVSAVKDVPVAASVAVVASVATTAVPSRIGATSLAITAGVSTSATSAKPVDASLSITATVATSAAVGILATLTVTATVATSATPTRVASTSRAITATIATTATLAQAAAASVSVAVAIATSIVDSRTTTAGLALTVALVASATVGGAAPDIVGGSIRDGTVAATVRASHIAGAVRAADVATSPIGATTRGGVIHGV